MSLSSAMYIHIMGRRKRRRRNGDTRGNKRHDDGEYVYTGNYGFEWPNKRRKKKK